MAIDGAPGPERAGADDRLRDPPVPEALRRDLAFILADEDIGSPRRRLPAIARSRTAMVSTRLSLLAAVGAAGVGIALVDRPYDGRSDGPRSASGGPGTPPAVAGPPYAPSPPAPDRRAEAAAEPAKVAPAEDTVAAAVPRGRDGEAARPDPSARVQRPGPAPSIEMPLPVEVAMTAPPPPPPPPPPPLRPAAPSATDAAGPVAAKPETGGADAAAAAASRREAIARRDAIDALINFRRQQ